MKDAEQPVVATRDDLICGSQPLGQGAIRQESTHVKDIQLSLSISLSHTHIHTHSLFLSLTLTHSLSFPFSLSLSFFFSLSTIPNDHIQRFRLASPPPLLSLFTLPTQRHPRSYTCEELPDADHHVRVENRVMGYRKRRGKKKEKKKEEVGEEEGKGRKEKRKEENDLIDA